MVRAPRRTDGTGDEADRRYGGQGGWALRRTDGTGDEEDNTGAAADGTGDEDDGMGAAAHPLLLEVAPGEVPRNGELAVAADLEPEAPVPSTLAPPAK